MAGAQAARRNAFSPCGPAPGRARTPGKPPPFLATEEGAGLPVSGQGRPRRSGLKWGMCPPAALSPLKHGPLPRSQLCAPGGRAQEGRGDPTPCWTVPPFLEATQAGERQMVRCFPQLLLGSSRLELGNMAFAPEPHRSPVMQGSLRAPTKGAAPTRSGCSPDLSWIPRAVSPEGLASPGQNPVAPELVDGAGVGQLDCTGLSALVPGRPPGRVLGRVPSEGLNEGQGLTQVRPGGRCWSQQEGQAGL